MRVHVKSPTQSRSAVKSAAVSMDDASDPNGVWRVTLTAPTNAANAVTPNSAGNAPASPTPPAVMTAVNNPAPQAHTTSDSATPRAITTHNAPDFRRTVVFSVAIRKTSPDFPPFVLTFSVCPGSVRYDLRTLPPVPLPFNEIVSASPPWGKLALS